MKTLILNGSPRKSGDTMALVGEMLRHLKGESIVVNAYDGEIAPCTDCRYCWRQEGCSIQDGMQRVYRLLDEVDNVVIASPVYFSELTGQLLAVMSRLQTFYAGKYKRGGAARLKPKHGALVLAAGGDTHDWTRPTGTADILFRMMNARPIGVVITPATDSVPAAEDGGALNQARLLAQRLNELTP